MLISYIGIPIVFLIHCIHCGKQTLQSTATIAPHSTDFINAGNINYELVVYDIFT